MTRAVDVVETSVTTEAPVSQIQALAPAPDPIAGLIAIPVSIISAVVNTLLSPFLGQGGAPSQPPLLWAVLGWIRREIQTTLFNRRPVLAAPTDVEQVDRVVTGTTVGTDPDGDKVTYTVSSTSAGGGTVAIDEQGGFTYTAPESWDGTSILTDSFTVTVSDGGSFHLHGLASLFFGNRHTTSRSISVALAPTSLEPTATVTGTVTVPTSRTAMAQGTDGTFAVTYRTGSGTTADPYRTTITVLRPGKAAVESTADGSVSGPITVLADGTAAVTTVTGSGTVDDPHLVHFTVMRPGAGTTIQTTPGLAGFAVTNGAGTAVGGLNHILVDGVPRMATVRVARVGEPPIVITIDGQSLNPPMVGADGTVVFRSTLLADDGSAISSTVNVLRAGSRVLEKYTFAEDGSSRLAGDPALGTDGTVAYATTSGSGAVGDPVVTTVTGLHPTEGASTSTTEGDFLVASVGADGTVAYATQSGAGAATETTVTVLRRGQEAAVSTTVGRHYITQIGADGTVAYQTVMGVGSPTDPYQITVTVLRANEDPVVASADTHYLFIPLIGDDGTVVVDAMTGPSGDGYRRQYQVLRPGQEPVTIAIADLPSSTAMVGPDGTVAVNIAAGAGTEEDPTRTDILILRPGQLVPMSYSAPGRPRDVPTIGDDGTVAVNSVDGPTGLVTVIRPGQDAVTYSDTGLLDSPPIMGADGVIYQLLETNGRTDTGLIVIKPSGESKTLDFEGLMTRFTLHETGGAALLIASTDPVTSMTTYTSYEITLGPYRPAV